MQQNNMSMKTSDENQRVQLNNWCTNAGKG